MTWEFYHKVLGGHLDLQTLTKGGAFKPAGPGDRIMNARLEAEGAFINPVPAGVFLTKAQHIDWAVRHPAPRGRRQRLDQLRIRTYGDVGLVTGLVIATGGDGREDRTVFTDVFVRRNGRWQAVNAQENAVQPMPGR